MMMGEHGGGEVGSAIVFVFRIELAEPRSFPAECLPSHGFRRNARADAAIDQLALFQFSSPAIEFPGLPIRRAALRSPQSGACDSCERSSGDRPHRSEE